RRNRVVRKLIANARAIRRESRRSRIVDCIAQYRAPERIHGWLSIEDELRQQRRAEVASPIRECRHGCNSRVDELCFAELLEVKKEETLAVTVVEITEPDESTDVESVVV